MIGFEGQVAGEESLGRSAGRISVGLAAVLESLLVGWLLVGVVDVQLTTIKLLALQLIVSLGRIGSVDELDISEAEYISINPE